MARVFLGLGSNVGDGAAILRAAFRELTTILAGARLSRLWRSRALYVGEQPDFVNGAAVGETGLSPRDLLAAIHAIEASFGRDRAREMAKGQRSLDIDILLYGTLAIREADLVIPHAGLRDRRFALLPLLDLDASLTDPTNGEAYATIVEDLPPQGIYLLG